MNAISYGRVGFANKRNKRLLIVIPGFIAFLFLAMVTPDGLSPLFTVFNLAMILYFRQDQKKLYDLHVGRGGDKAGVGVPLLIGISAYAMLLVLFILGVLVA